MENFNDIMDVYGGLVFKFVSYQKKNNKEIFKYFSQDELIQLGRISLWKTNQSWNPEKGKFNTLFYTIFNNEIKMEIRRLKKYTPESSSLNAKFLDKSGEEKESIDLIVSSYSDVPAEMKVAVKNTLSHFEKKEQEIVSYAIMGYTNQEIALLVGDTLRQINRNKIKLMKRFRELFKYYYDI